MQCTARGMRCWGGQSPPYDPSGVFESPDLYARRDLLGRLKYEYYREFFQLNGEGSEQPFLSEC